MQIRGERGSLPITMEHTCLVGSEKISESFLRVFLDQLHHPLTPYGQFRLGALSMGSNYFWHYRTPFLIFHVPKGHLSTLMLVDFEFRIINIWDGCQRHCTCSV